jgi:hypothetical protein
MLILKFLYLASQKPKACSQLNFKKIVMSIKIPRTHIRYTYEVWIRSTGFQNVWHQGMPSNTKELLAVCINTLFLGKGWGA